MSIPSFPDDTNSRPSFGVAGTALEFDNVVVRVPSAGNVPAEDGDWLIGLGATKLKERDPR